MATLNDLKQLESEHVLGIYFIGRVRRCFYKTGGLFGNSDDAF
jgi:hypothetical protein